MVNWEHIIEKINNRNLIAVKTLHKLGIKPILKQTQDRSYYCVRDTTDRFFVEVHPKEFPYNKATTRCNGGGSISNMYGHLIYLDDYLEIRTRFVLPWYKYNSKLLDCPRRIKLSIAEYIKWFYQNDILKCLKTKEETIKRTKLTDITNTVIKYLRMPYIEPKDKFEFMKAIKEWESIRYG